MSDSVTNELIYETLKSIPRQVAEVKDGQKDMAADLRSVKTHIAGFMQNEVAQDGAIASIKDRLERIERRLELGD